VSALAAVCAGLLHMLNSQAALRAVHA